MADNIQATPRNYVGGLLTDAYKWMQSPQRTQQMQGFAGLLGTTGVPQTIERMAYGEPLTNIGRANVPLLKPETADALMTVAPFAGDVAQLAGKGLLGAGKLAGSAVNDAMVYGRGPLASITPQPMGVMPKSIVREGNPIQSAVVLVGDRIFTGNTHTDAFNRAIYEGAIRKEGSKFIYPKDAEVNSDLFMTKDGQIIDRLQASKMFDIGASETAIKEGLMQNKPPSSMSVDSYIEQAKAIRQQKEKPSFTYPQEEAMRLAQQRAALPVEQGGLGLLANNTADERAAAMGFDTPAYHGTNREFSQFSNEMLGANTKAKSAAKAHFSSSSPDTANSYVKTGNIYDDTAPAYEQLFKIPNAWDEYANAATNADKWAVLSKYGLSEGSGRVIPLQLNLGNPRVKDYKGMGYRDTTYADELTAAKRGKKDSVVFKHTFDAGGESPAGMTDIYAVMSPDQIRSRFAAFDPFRRTSATAAAMGVAAPDLLAQEQPVITQQQIDDELAMYGLLGR